MTIYIADDEIWISIGLKKLIEKSGLPFQVIGEANNGITALEEIKHRNPDVVFTDIRMPGLSGLDLLERIKSDASPSSEIIIISGYSNFEYARTAMRKGASDYLLKPVSQEDLNNALMKILKKKSHSEITETEPPIEEAAINHFSLDRILEEMKRDYAKDISLTKLSEKYGISSGHLSMRIKQELGISFSEYITAKRMQKAKELLKNEALSVEEIADAVGYHDYFYFTKVFKKTLGISPSKYRNELRTH